MASHNDAISTLLDKGFRHRQLENILASNGVLDWFGRTFIGQHKIVDFFQNSNSTYDHHVMNVESRESVEERPYHFITREQPLENFKNLPDLAGDKQWLDCNTHSPVKIKEGHQTPTNKTTPSVCPPAPHRRGLVFNAPSEDQLDSDTSSDNLNESGIRPLDSSISISRNVLDKSPECKRIKKDHKQENSLVPSSPAESDFSDLKYLEALGTLMIHRLEGSSNEPEKREFKMLVSYRVHKSDPTNLQIALIIYKPNSQNPKTRRNLMVEFESRADVSPSNEWSNIMNGTSSRCQTIVRDQKTRDESTKQISTDDAKNARVSKRPLISKTSLRF